MDSTTEPVMNVAARSATASIHTASVASDPLAKPSGISKRKTSAAGPSDAKTRKQNGVKARKARGAQSKKRPAKKSHKQAKKSAPTTTRKMASVVKTPEASVTKEEAPISQLQPVRAEELPHNVSPAFTGQSALPRPTEPTGSSGNEVTIAIQHPENADTKDTPEMNHKKKTSPRSYGWTPGESPFPFWPTPTPEQCEELNQLLTYAHGEAIAPATIPRPSIDFPGCGEAPCVLDALIRTLLSAATQGSNAALSFSGLAKKFGVLETGIGKGSVNWEAVRRAPLRDVFDAIKRGGLADVKSKSLKGILDKVYQVNHERYTALKAAQANKEPDGLPDESRKDKEYELACAEENFLSLNHLHNLSTEDAMAALIQYPGIGIKTAACVALFCLQRPCFAVDTHIFRICKWLGWVPADSASEVTTFGHLNVRIPDRLKYSLHHLLIKHGKQCPRCRAATGESSKDWELGCPIDHLLTRTGKRKGGPEIFSRSQRAKRSRVSKRTAGKKKGPVAKKAPAKKETSVPKSATQQEATSGATSGSIPSRVTAEAMNDAPNAERI